MKKNGAIILRTSPPNITAKMTKKNVLMAMIQEPTRVTVRPHLPVEEAMANPNPTAAIINSQEKAQEFQSAVKTS